MVNPFDKQALAARLAVREQEQPKAGPKDEKAEPRIDQKDVEAFVARFKGGKV
jgi:hypothetical protein